MRIERTGYFYAAHRNQHLRGDKCHSLHGHTYYVTACFNVGQEGDDGVTMLFSEIETHLSHFTDTLDHSILVDKDDSALVMAMKLLTTQDMSAHKIVHFDGPTSAEMLARWLYEKLTNCVLDVEWVRLRETQSSTVVYRKADHEKLQSQ